MSTTPTPDEPLGDATPPGAAGEPGDAMPATAAGEPGDEPWTSPAAPLEDLPAAAVAGVVPEVGAGGSPAGWRTRLARHPVATGAVAATLAAGVAFGAGVLVGQATSSPETSAWTERSGLPGEAPDGLAGAGRGGFDPGMGPGGADDGSTRGGNDGAGGDGGAAGTDT